MKLRSFARSDTGRVRRRNEDDAVHEPGLALFGIADGVGGLPGGAEASRAATGVLRSRVAAHPPGEPVRGLLARAAEEADRVVAALGASINPVQGIATTLTVGWFAGGSLHLIHAGDSRAYRWRDGSLLGLTEDHTVENDIERRRQRGEPPSLLEGHASGALTRCVGQGTGFAADASVVDVRPGDRFLFATDGLTRHVADDEIVGILGSAAQPAAVVDSCVERALHRGGLDNVTVVAVFVDDFP